MEGGEREGRNLGEIRRERVREVGRGETEAGETKVRSDCILASPVLPVLIQFYSQTRQGGFRKPCRGEREGERKRRGR